MLFEKRACHVRKDKRRLVIQCRGILNPCNLIHSNSFSKRGVSHMKSIQSNDLSRFFEMKSSRPDIFLVSFVVKTKIRIKKKICLVSCLRCRWRLLPCEILFKVHIQAEHEMQSNVAATKGYFYRWRRNLVHK